MANNEQPLILVADDEPSTLALVATHLRTRGYRVVEAGDGDQAWELCTQELPDLVVLDVMMPGMSGWEVCRRIREAVSLAHTGVVMLTGIGDTLNEITSPLYGADVYLDKPFQFSRLGAVVEETLVERGKGSLGRPLQTAGPHDQPAAASAEEEGVVSSLPVDWDLETTKASGKTAPKAAVKKTVAKKAPAKTVAKKAAVKKPVAKKAAKKAPAKASKKKAAVKKTVAKKAAVKKAPAKASKKAAVKKTVAKKAAVKKAPAKASKKAAVKKAPAKASKKAVAKKASKKAPAKTVAKKAAVKKAPAKASKKAAVKKTVAKKAAVKKAPAKASKKAAVKKAPAKASRKAVAKKAPAKKRRQGR